jgi:hypothetical protein
MAILPRNRPRILRAFFGLTLALVLGVASPGQTADTFLDAVLAGVNGTIVAASDVAIARALSLFGAEPSGAPIRKADAEKLVDSRLIEQEAVQLAIGGTPQDLEEAWQAAAERAGGLPRLQAWMDQIGVAEAWVKTMVEADLRWRRFIDLRFRSFVFISDAEVTQVLGPGSQSAEVREKTREKLRAEAVSRDVAEWLAEARKRASIQYAEPGESGVPLPFPMPPTNRP